MAEPLEVEFRKWVENNARTGVNGFDKEEKRFNENSITKCYGSFEYPETNKRFIVLEYTPEGSLLDFFKRTPPDNSNDLELLWDRLLQLLDGLYLLHNPDKNDSKSLSGIHHDIQPANILVFREEGTSTYDVSFKLADFGLAEIVRTNGGKGVKVPIDNEGNRMYFDGDFISRCMSEFILEFMMVEAPRRLMAMQAKGQAKHMIDTAKSGLTVRRPITPEPIPPVSNRVSTYSGESKVSVWEVYEALKAKSKWKHFRRHKSQPSDVGMSLPGMRHARNQINRHGGRDQILVIDDYGSMKEHRRNVAETARVISYSVKVSDKDGMDLYFASDSCNPQKCQNSSDVEAKVRSKATVDGRCDMKKCLEDVMDQVKANGTKPTGIYIFTDGIWDPDHKPEVDDVIHESIKLLIEKKAKPADLMFQFIQFGHDPEGSKRLKFLDDDCKRTHRGVEYDIVDTKHCDDHVPKIIIGSISKHNDNDD
ncbi:hypothetical protein H9Q69_011400 [Fusarium xylarioides]|nr:hypothetical protein H9Q69_011400 [Fusarium xylarioides]